MTASQTTSASYEVGYRKPPRHTQFQKGRSGNPGGRPRRPAKRLEELALYEAYRTTIVMEDGHAVPMPAIQAVLRSQLQSAAGGNVRAQRDILAMIQHIELIRNITGGADDDVVDDDDTDDAIDGDDSDVDDTADNHEVDDDADADEPAQRQADEIDTHGDGRQLVARVERNETREHPLNAALPPPGFAGAQPGLHRSSSTAPPAVCAPQPEDPAAMPAARTPSLPSGSRTGQRRGVRPRRNGPERSAGVQPPRRQPGRRRRSRAVNAGKIREAQSGSSRRSPGRTNRGPGLAQAAGGHARAPAALPNEGEN